MNIKDIGFYLYMQEQEKKKNDSGNGETKYNLEKEQTTNKEKCGSNFLKS